MNKKHFMRHIATYAHAQKGSSKDLSGLRDWAIGQYAAHLETEEGMTKEVAQEAADELAAQVFRNTR